jgi:hypothetical protein
VTRGELDFAIRRAMNILDQWIDATGVIDPRTSYYYELQSVVEDAVHCGAQAETKDFEKLECEDKLPATCTRRPPRTGKDK